MIAKLSYNLKGEKKKPVQKTKRQERIGYSQATKEERYRKTQ